MLIQTQTIRWNLGLGRLQMSKHLPAEKMSSLNDLLIAYGNAEFSCGEYVEGDDDGPKGYNDLLERMRAAKKAVLDSIAALERDAARYQWLREHPAFETEA